jgi:hypothetical protein
MRLGAKQLAAFVLAGILVVISGAQVNETFSAIRFWWRVGHPASADFVVPHWWTHYTIASALFAPAWLVCIGAALLLSRRWPLVAVVTLSSFLIIEPLSCISAASWVQGSDGFLGLAELPFAEAERSADWEHLARIDALLKRAGDDAGAFPTSDQDLRSAVGNLALEPSPYVQGGKRIAFDLRFVLNQGVPYTTNPKRPGIVYYAVNPSGRQFVLTISGLNAPIRAQSSMMKAEAFAGEEQPWGGLLATEEALYPK